MIVMFEESVISFTKLNKQCYNVVWNPFIQN